MAAPSQTKGVIEHEPEGVDISVRALGIALVGASLGYYLITGMPQLRLAVFGPTVTLHMVTAAVALVYVLYLALYRRLPGGTPIDWPLALVVVAYALATAGAVYWRVSLESMLQVLMAVVVFYALSDIRLLRARDVQWGLMLAGAAASFYALWVVRQDYVDWLTLARSVEGFTLGDLIPPTVPRVHDVSDHPNILAMTLVLIIPFYALSIYRPVALWERAGGVIGLLAAVLTVFLTVSRGAWFGAAAGLAVTGGGIAVLALPALRVGFSPAAPLRWLRSHRAATAALVAVLVVVVALGVLATVSLWGSRPQWLFHASFSPRRDVLSAGVDMFKDHPILGTGPGAYALLYPEYSGDFPVHGVHAHNVYLQTAVDLGLVGLAAFLVLGAATGWMLWRTVRGGTIPQRLLAIACTGALLGFLAHGLVDAPNIWKAPLIALAAVGAVIVGNFREAQAPDNTSGGRSSPEGSVRPKALPIRRLGGWAPRVLVLVVVVALLGGWARGDWAHAYYARGVSRAGENRLAEAVADASRAVDLDPQFAIYQLQLGLTEVRAYLSNGPRTLLDQGIQHLRRGVELEPRGAIGYANLARALELAGQREEARDVAVEARHRAVRDEAVVLAAGVVLEDLGETEDAVQTYAGAISLNTALADSPFWTSSEFRAEHYAEILSRSVLGLNPCRLGTALADLSSQAAGAIMRDLPELAEECAQVVASSPDNVDFQVRLGSILLDVGDVEGAGKHLLLAARRQPDNGRARTELGRWYAAKGDVEAARREWLLATQLGDPEGVMLLGDSYPPGEIPQEVVRKLRKLLPKAASAVQHDMISVLYYRMKFARGAPVVMLIPGEWQQAVPGQYTRMQQALSRWRAEAAPAGR